MDTYKDAVALNDLWASGEAPWRRRALRAALEASLRALKQRHRLANPAQAPLARIGPAVGLLDELAHLPLGQQAARPGDRGDAAGEVHGLPEPVAGAAERRLRSPRRRATAGNSSPSASAASIRRSAASSSGSRLGRGEHRGIADRLDEPHGRLGHFAGERLQAHGESRPSSSGGTSSPRRVKPTRSAKQTATSREPGSCPRCARPR